MESLAVTDKEPVLLFTGDSKRHVVKWEKAGLNTVKFDSDKLVMQRKLKDAPVEWQNIDEPKEITDQHVATLRQQTPSTYLSPKFFSGRQTDEHDAVTTVNLKSPPQKMLWIENIDLLIVCDERGVIYAWGYEDVEAHPEDFAKHYAESAKSDSNILQNIRAATKPLSVKEPGGKAVRKRSIKPPKPAETVADSDTVDSSRSRSTLLPRSTVDSSNVDMDIRVHSAMTDWQTYKHYLNRASGFFCRFVLWGHDVCVSGLDYVYDAQADQHILISASWDRRIITWDLMAGQIIDVCKRDKTEAKVFEEKETPGEYELVSEGQITDIAFSAKRNEIAYCSRDAHLYVRKFSTNGRRMKLVRKWHSHNGEVLQV
ncbi:hypothetical protein RvY_05538-2 [Ramazzottius varieornatus]|uniref:Uncharacterized protein n=1 Tax=Ramazzottius varieornatus TaxID=947166 RepID=A0A1D1V4D6_RAMVA|nr:hypothetical protein RvY_05538-2 [Ramazzottius varieornatus]